MEYSQFYKTTKAIADATSSILNPVNEAYHEKDREAKDDIRNKLQHHIMMLNRHRDISSGTAKNKELSKHDLACLAHGFACKHYENIGGNLGGNFGGLPEDYHNDREFYTKLNDMISNRADKKSKDCNVDCNTNK